MAESGSTPSLHQALATIAASARAAYSCGSHLRVRSSGIVHEVAMTLWFADERMPGPACMVGVSGWDPAAARPDCGAVTCRRCLKLTHTEPDSQQLELFAAEPDQASAGGRPLSATFRSEARQVLPRVGRHSRAPRVPGRLHIDASAGEQLGREQPTCARLARCSAVSPPRSF